MSNNNLILDYTQLDEETIGTKITEYLQSTTGWGDYTNDHTLQVMNDTLRGVAVFLIYLMERKAEEVYLDSAKTETAIRKIARSMGYIPRRKVSSVTKLRFTLEAVHANSVIIPAYTRVSSNSGVPFITKEQVTIAAGLLTADVDAVQGVLHQEDGATNPYWKSDGSKNQVKFLEMSDPENSFVLFFVNGEQWNVKDTLIYSSGTDIDVRVEASPEFTGLNFYLGDGVAGKVPENLADYHVMALESRGSEGNIYILGDIINIDDTIYDSLDIVVDDISVTNIEKALGGADEETIEEIRNNAPLLFKVGDGILVSKADWEDYLSSYPGVKAARAWGEYEESPLVPDISMFNVVKASLLMSDGNVMTESFKATLLDDLMNKKGVTLKVELFDAEQIPVIITVNAYVPKTYNKEFIRSNIEVAIDGYINFDSLSLQDPLRDGDFSALVESVDGLKNRTGYQHHNIVIWDQYIEGDGVENYFTYELKLGDILPESVEVYINDTKIGDDDGSGNIIDSGGSKIDTGNINYTNGTGYVRLFSILSPGEFLIFRYKQNYDGDIVPGFNQVIVQKETYVNVNYKD